MAAELRGVIENETAYVEFSVDEHPVRWVVDTGATHELLITKAEWERLRLTFDGTIGVEDFRGGSRPAPFALVEIDWLGTRRTVQVLLDVDAREPLLGLGLLSETCVCFAGGTVSVRPVGA